MLVPTGTLPNIGLLRFLYTQPGRDRIDPQYSTWNFNLICTRSRKGRKYTLQVTYQSAVSQLCKSTVSQMTTLTESSLKAFISLLPFWHVKVYLHLWLITIFLFSYHDKHFHLPASIINIQNRSIQGGIGNLSTAQGQHIFVVNFKIGHFH